MMKFESFLNRARVLALLPLLFMLPACKSTPKIDWNSRIGTYTYDQAVIDMGPPDKMAEISEGRVAEWLVNRSRSPSFSVGFGSFGGSGGVGVGTGTGGNVIENYLRLNFNKEGVLESWENTRH